MTIIDTIKMRLLRDEIGTDDIKRYVEERMITPYEADLIMQEKLNQVLLETNEGK